MLGQRLAFSDEELSLATPDAGMFSVKEINRLKILQDVIDHNLRPRQAAEMLGITSLQLTAAMLPPIWAAWNE